MAQKHIHRYMKATLGRNNWPIYKCSLPDCTHYVADELAEGRFTICWRCGEKFVLTRPMMRVKKPYCQSCSRKQRLENVEVIPQHVKKFADDLLDELLGVEAKNFTEESLGVVENMDLDDDDES